MNPAKGGWAILLSVLVAMVLSVIHLPSDWPTWLAWLRPNWLLLVIFFWVIELPHRVGLIAAWCLGLLLDALVNDPLGVNGLILASVTYVAWRFFERLRMYSVLQQAGLIFALVLAAELFRLSAQSWGQELHWRWLVLMVPTVSALLWPFVYLLLLRVRQAARVE